MTAIGDSPLARRLRDAATRFTTPLLPDDYLTLVNPLWSVRELRGRVSHVTPEAEDAATLVVQPGWGWSFEHAAGQYIGIGVQIDGRFVWRSYSLTTPPSRDGKRLVVTVRGGVRAAGPVAGQGPHAQSTCKRGATPWPFPTSRSSLT